MNKRIFFLPLLIVTLCAPSYLLSFEDYHARQAVNSAIWYILAYPSRLRLRQNMPESKEDYFNRVEIGLEGLNTHLKKTIKDDYDWSVTGPMIQDLQWEINAKWKQSWWDKNPGLGDLILTTSIISAIGILVACINGSNPGAGGAGVPAHGGGGHPHVAPPPYQV